MPEERLGKIRRIEDDSFTICQKAFTVVQSLAHIKGRLPSMNEKLSAEELFSMAKGNFIHIENVKIHLFLANSKLYKKILAIFIERKSNMIFPEEANAMLSIVKSAAANTRLFFRKKKQQEKNIIANSLDKEKPWETDRPMSDINTKEALRNEKEYTLLEYRESQKLLIKKLKEKKATIHSKRVFGACCTPILAIIYELILRRKNIERGDAEKRSGDIKLTEEEMEVLKKESREIVIPILCDVIKSSEANARHLYLRIEKERAKLEEKDGAVLTAIFLLKRLWVSACLKNFPGGYISPFIHAIQQEGNELFQKKRNGIGRIYTDTRNAVLEQVVNKWHLFGLPH